jgi:hypothetical protein
MPTFLNLFSGIPILGNQNVRGARPVEKGAFSLNDAKHESVGMDKLFITAWYRPGELQRIFSERI